MKSFHIHFVCTGNVYRSRLAEAYLRSKQLPDIEVSSSGTQAEEDAHGPISRTSARLANYHHLLLYLKPNWTQTSRKILDKADLVIFMTSEQYAYTKTNFGFGNGRYEVWNIQDLTEEILHNDDVGPEHDLKWTQRTEKAFAEIKNKVDDLCTRLQKN